MLLLPRDQLIVTSAVDHGAWNYDGILGFVSRQRFALVEALVPACVGSILEIGYGSGVFMPTLATKCERLFGVDVHDRALETTAALARNGIVATLSRASAEDLPFSDASIDAVVAVSTFEFIADIGGAAREIARVLRPDGIAIVVTPTDHPLLDLALHVATGESATRDFGERRKTIVPLLSSALELDRVERFPRFAPIPIYRAYRFRRPHERTVRSTPVREPGESEGEPVFDERDRKIG